MMIIDITNRIAHHSRPSVLVVSDIAHETVYVHKTRGNASYCTNGSVLTSEIYSPRHYLDGTVIKFRRGFGMFSNTTTLHPSYAREGKIGNEMAIIGQTVEDAVVQTLSIPHQKSENLEDLFEAYCLRFMPFPNKIAHRNEYFSKHKPFPSPYSLSALEKLIPQFF